MPPDGAWIENPGYRSAFVEGRRVYVRLRNGMEPAESWDVYGFRDAPGVRWSLTGHPFDVVEFQLAA